MTSRRPLVSAFAFAFTAALITTQPAAAQRVVGPACGSAPTTTSFAGTTGAIPSNSSVVFTTNVAGQGAYLWDVDLSTWITHTACFDLDMTLTSPQGTTVTIATDIGGLNDNLFNGTLWDDNVNDPVTDHVYTNLVTATPLSPEGRLAAFRGENPNGVWKLTIADDAVSNIGALNAWSLSISSLGFTPVETTTSFTRLGPIPLADTATTVDVMPVAGLGTYLAKVVLYVEISHTANTDLDMVLISPSGTVVTIATDAGGSFDDVFNGTTFDPDSTDPVTDHLYTNLVVATLLSPEGSFDNFLGQNPNGNWTLSITDDAVANIGTLVRWDLRVTTTANPLAPAGSLFGGTSGAIPDSGIAAPVSFSATVTGLVGYLWDVDLATTIAHGACADLDITLTSPAGTTIVVTTDNGFTGGVFNGTLFDDDANDPATDHFYTTNVVATPLSPEGRLAAFRGENPNGTWTLTIADDSLPLAGSLNAWSLDLSMIAAAPGTTSTNFSKTSNLPVLDLATTADTQNVAGLGTALAKVVLYTEIQHTWCDDLDITLTAPSGTVVVVSTDNGLGLDDVFNGTTWDPASTNAPSDYAYVDFVAAPLLAPEGAFDSFLGEDPNGVWTLSVADDFAPDTGMLVSWGLTLTTCGAVPPVTMCTPNAPGTSHGCAATISATANPDVAHSNTCVVTVAQIEGQQTGVVFYGLTTVNSLWCAGGASFLCVKAPLWRAPPQSTGGSAGGCNGSLVLDWNAYQLANPGALGNPWSVGAKVYVQGWFRDPPSCKTTFLSEALELTYQP